MPFDTGSKFNPAPSSRVFIRNLPETFTSDELRFLFSEVGAIGDECWVFSHPHLSGRFGWVQYSDIPTAQRAIDRFQGHVLTNQVRDGGLSVMFAKDELKNDELKQDELNAPSNRVFIRNLPETFTAGELRDLFGVVGTIGDECWVSKPGLSGRAGMVQYSDISSAQKAIDRFQGHVLTDQIHDGGLVVLFAKARRLDHHVATTCREPAPPSNRVFIHNLPKTFTTDDLRALFGEVGEIGAECWVSKPRPSGCFGWVQYSDTPTAQKAIDRFQGHVLKGQVRGGGLSVEFNRLRSGEAAPPSNRVFINNLPKKFTSYELRALFSEVGTIDECWVSAQGAGMVQYSDIPTAQKAIERFRGHVLKGQGRDGGLSVQFAKARRTSHRVATDSAPPSNRVFIHNLPKTFTTDDLRALFGEVGEIGAECWVSKPRPSGCFGVVQYSDIPTAQKAIDRFQGHVLKGQVRDGGLSVQWAESVPS